MDGAVNALARSRSTICLWLVALAGCFQSPPPGLAPIAAPPAAPAAASPVANADQLTANEILNRLLKTYRSAATYQDRGVVKLQFKQAGQPSGDQWPCAVQFARPSKLSLAAYQAVVKCDGRELVA